MEKCTTIHQETIFKDNGKMIKSKEKEQWTGLIYDKSMLGNGKITTNKDGECIFGLNQKVKENTSEIDTKVHGLMESEMDMESFIMPMDQSMKDIGKITWSKDTLFIQMKTDKHSLFSSKKTGWFVKIIPHQLKSRAKRGQQKRRSNLIFIPYA